MICYKMVDENLGSAVLLKGDIFYIQYILNEWVVPKIGKIFVFNNLKTAKNFISSKFSCKIFKAEADVLETSEYMSVFCSNEMIEAFWGGGGVDMRGPPTGTLFCNKLMLIEEVT